MADSNGKAELTTSGSKGVSKASKDLLSTYLAEVRRYPILSPEEEHEYAVRYQETGDPKAAEKLITSNLRLVIKIAWQYHRKWAQILDLIQEGSYGLVEALDRYDPSRQVRFSSYAQYWIRAMILRFLLDYARIVRLGSTRDGRKLFYNLEKERNRLISQGFDPTEARLAERLGVAPKEIRAFDVFMRAPALSLNAPAGDDPDGRTLGEIVPEDIPNDPESNAAKREFGALVKTRLGEFADSLTDERERVIWEKRLIASDRVSLAALGREFGVSKERVRQIEARIMNRLKEYWSSQGSEEVTFEFELPED